MKLIVWAPDFKETNFVNLEEVLSSEVKVHLR